MVPPRKHAVWSTRAASVGFAAIGLLLAIGSLTAADGPVAHWPLRGDSRDVAGHRQAAIRGQFNFAADGPAGQPHTAMEAASANAWLEIAVKHAPKLATGDFSVAAWFYIDENTPEPVGGLVDQFDPVAGAGWYLSLVSNSAATSSQANRRQLQFGLGAGDTLPQWVDCGRPGSAVLVFALATFNGQLYAGTCESGAAERGHVLRYSGPVDDVGVHPTTQANPDRKADGPTEANWIDCGSPDAANSVTALAVFHDELYAATGCYRLRGSSLPDSPNQTPGGNVYRFKADGQWEHCGKLGQAEAINGLVVFRDTLYASSTYSPGVFRYEGGQQWTSIGTPNGRRVEALTVFDNSVFGGGYDAGEIYRYTPEAGWSVVGTLPDTTQTYGFGIYRDQLYVGTWPTGSVYRFDHDRWTACGRLGSEKEVMPIVLSHGNLLAGTLPLAEVYRYRHGEKWQRMAALDSTPDVVYRRVWCMATFAGNVFAGTLPSGHVYRSQPAPLATFDGQLRSGWHHAIGIRAGNELQLAIDGQIVARAHLPKSKDIEVATTAPLRLAAGPQAGFRGRLSDVRIYNRALSDDEIRTLGKTPTD